MKMPIIKLVNHKTNTETNTEPNIDFREWFWGKFEEWRKGTTNGPTAFARYLGIEKYQSVSDWLNGKYKPKSQEHIAKIAAKYPEIYEILDTPRDLPDVAVRAGAALDEIRRTLQKKGVELDSPEAERISIDIMRRFGFKYIKTEEVEDED